MNFFDERVLAALKDGKPRSFTTLLSEVCFSHNTLQQHLERLMAQGLIIREKVAANGFGRPKFAYHIPSRTTKQVIAALEDPQVELVTIPFSRIRHICRFEKGGYCKKQREILRLKSAPKSKNKNYNHFTPIKGQASAQAFFSRIYICNFGVEATQHSFTKLYNENNIFIADK